MSAQRRSSYGPVIRPLVVMVLALAAAFVIQQGPWLPVVLSIAVIAATFAVLAWWQNRPPEVEGHSECPDPVLLIGSPAAGSNGPTPTLTHRLGDVSGEARRLHHR